MVQVGLAVPTRMPPHLPAAAQEEAAVAAEAAGICDALEKALEGWELRRLLGGPYDARGAVLTIQVRRGLHPGMGLPGKRA